MNEQNPRKLAELEAFLFHYGEAAEIKKIAKILKLKEKEAADLVDFLEKNLREAESRGLMILKQNNRVQLVTKPDFEDIKSLSKKNSGKNFHPLRSRRFQLSLISDQSRGQQLISSAA